MGLFGPPNIEKMKAKKDVKGLIKALGYRKSLKTRVMAAEALGQLGNPLAVSALITSLTDFSRVKKASVEALGQIKDPRSVEALIAIIKNKANGDLHQDAILALGQQGTIPAMEALVTTLKDSKKVVVDAAEKVLTKSGTPAVNPLIALLRDNKCNQREIATRILGKISNPSAIVPIATMLQGESHGSVISIAVETLDKLGWQPDKGRAGALFWTFKKQWDHCLQIGAPAVEPLILYSSTTDVQLNKAIAETLYNIGEPAVEQLIVELKSNFISSTVFAAKLLVALYNSGKLDDAHQRLILEQRQSIMKSHDDNESHTDFDSDHRSSDCHYDQSFHGDLPGTGVDFPV